MCDVNECNCVCQTLSSSLDSGTELIRADTVHGLLLLEMLIKQNFPQMATKLKLGTVRTSVSEEIGYDIVCILLDFQCNIFHGFSFSRMKH